MKLFQHFRSAVRIYSRSTSASTWSRPQLMASTLSSGWLSSSTISGINWLTRAPVPKRPLCAEPQLYIRFASATNKFSVIKIGSTYLCSTANWLARTQWASFCSPSRWWLVLCGLQCPRDLIARHCSSPKWTARLCLWHVGKWKWPMVRNYYLIWQDNEQSQPQ